MPELDVPLRLLGLVLVVEALLLAGLLTTLAVARAHPLHSDVGGHHLARANRARLARASQRGLGGQQVGLGAAAVDARRSHGDSALATRLLSTSPVEDSLDLVLDRLAHPSPVVRRAALAALAEILRDQVGSLEPARLGVMLSTVVGLLDRPYLLPRAAVGVALLGCPAASAPVLAARLPVTEAGRALAVTLLGLMRDPACFPALMAALTDSSAEVRARACAALADCDAIRAERGLVSALDDGAWWVRLHAARALGRLGAAWSVHALALRLHDPVDHVREEAAQALLLLGPPGILALRGGLGAPSLASRRAAGIALQHLGDEDLDLLGPLAAAGVLARGASRAADDDVAARLREGTRALVGCAARESDPVSARLADEALRRAGALPC